MKKTTLFLSILFFVGSLSAQSKNEFTPNLKLLQTWENAGQTSKQHKQPYIAVYRKDGKTLIYLASDHNSGKTLDMVDYIYKKYAPEIAVVEFERTGRKLKEKCSWNEFEYSAGIASDKNIPVVLADLSYEDKVKVVLTKNSNAYKAMQAEWMIKNAISYKKQFGKNSNAEKEVHNFKIFNHNPELGKTMNTEEFKSWFKKEFDKDFDKVELNTVFKKGWSAPKSTGTIFNKLSEDEDFYGRDPFMLKNIAAALNRYDIVYAAFGEGHYRSHRKVLEDMLGKPTYIWGLKEYKDRDNCIGFKIKEEILVRPEDIGL